MTYVETMAIEIHVDCVHEGPGDQYEILKATEKLINQIIADTKEACKNALFGEGSGCYEVIDQAEVKGE